MGYGPIWINNSEGVVLPIRDGFGEHHEMAYVPRDEEVKFFSQEVPRIGDSI